MRHKIQVVDHRIIAVIFAVQTGFSHIKWSASLSPAPISDVQVNHDRQHHQLMSTKQKRCKAGEWNKSTGVRHVRFD